MKSTCIEIGALITIFPGQRSSLILATSTFGGCPIPHKTIHLVISHLIELCTKTQLKLRKLNLSVNLISFCSNAICPIYWEIPMKSILKQKLAKLQLCYINSTNISFNLLIIMKFNE